MDPGYTELEHDLGTTEVLVYLIGRVEHPLTGEYLVHQEYYGIDILYDSVEDDFVTRGAYWTGLSDTHIKVYRALGDWLWPEFRLLIWKIPPKAEIHPVASFIYSPEDPKVNETVTFDASASYDPDGVIVSWEWDFGFGNTATGEVVAYTFDAAGNYYVWLSVTDDDGLHAKVYDIITVHPWEGYIEGNVVDADTGIPLEGAVVSADGLEDVTDATGFYSIEVPSGTYDVTAEMMGYVSQTVTDVSVASNETVIQDFALAPSP